MKTSKTLTTFDREMADRRFKKQFEQEYKEFALSEILLKLMQEEGISVRKLSNATGISPSVVQDIRSGSRKNMTVRNFLKMMNALGGKVAVKVKGRYVPIAG